jgi:hypothetical protein
MSAQARKQGEVNRLVDMVVEEVSLVDRAANNRKFLIVKRDQSMDDIDTDKAADDSPARDDSTAGGADGSPLGSAVEALESLTSIVEALGSLGASRDNSRLADLARKLKGTAEQILSHVEDGSESDDDAGPLGDMESLSEGEADSTADSAAEVQAQTKSKGRAKAPPPGKSKAKGPPPKPPGKGRKKGPPPPDEDAEEIDDSEDDEEDEDDEDPRFKSAKTALANLAKIFGAGAMPNATEVTPQAGSELTSAVSKLTQLVETLTKSVNDQQQRIGRVEKQFGLPNSAPVAEHVSKSNDESVGWPLDLNRPMDRQTVDKSVSFHDV